MSRATRWYAEILPSGRGVIAVLHARDSSQTYIRAEDLRHCGLWKASAPRGPPDAIDMDHDTDSEFMDCGAELTFIDMDKFLSTF